MIMEMEMDSPFQFSAVVMMWIYFILSDSMDAMRKVVFVSIVRIAHRTLIIWFAAVSNQTVNCEYSHFMSI